MLNIAIFGPPGSGKGTQSKMLLEKYRLDHISTGDILRDHIARKTVLGTQAKELIDKGVLVPDELIAQLLEEQLTEKVDSNGFLFDGFPRTVVQAHILEDLLSKLDTSLTCMISLEVDKEELTRRLLERSQIEGRSDDTLEVILERFKEYTHKTVPVIDFYKNRDTFFPINGIGEPKKIFETLEGLIDNVIRDKK